MFGDVHGVEISWVSEYPRHFLHPFVNVAKHLFDEDDSSTSCCSAENRMSPNKYLSNSPFSCSCMFDTFTFSNFFFSYLSALFFSALSFLAVKPFLV